MGVRRSSSGLTFSMGDEKTMNRDLMKQLLKQHEGSNIINGRHIVYKCPAKKWTLGYGRNVQERGVSEHEALFMLDEDLDECLVDLNKTFHDFFLFPESVQLALCDLRFCVGQHGFMKFKKMVQAVKDKNWSKVRDEIIDSDFYRKNGNRGADLVKLIETAV